MSKHILLDPKLFLLGSYPDKNSYSNMNEHLETSVFLTPKMCFPVR